MELKTVEIDGKTYAEVQDGKPVYLDGDKEIAFDAVATAATVTRLGKEAKGHRLAKEEAEAKLAAFDGIEDPAAAARALELVKSLDDGKIMSAEKAAAETKKAVEAATKAYVEKLGAAEKEKESYREKLHETTIGRSFAESQFIKEKMTLLPRFVRESFGRHFALEDGKIVATDANGDVIYSRSRPGEIASFDEALEHLVEACPERDHILKGRGQTGSGASGGAAGSSGPGTISRDDFMSLSPAQRAEKMASGNLKVVD